MINRDGVGAVKHLDVRALWLQQEREKNGLKVRKVPGERNPADLGTKAHPVARFEYLKQLCGLVDCGAIDRATAVGIHAVEMWARPPSAANGRGFLKKLVVLGALVVPARGDAAYQVQMTTGTVMEVSNNLWVLALLGWVVALSALMALAWMTKSWAKMSKRSGQQKVRTIGTQTVSTFKRHYKVPRMDNLADGEHGVWVD